MKWEPKYSWKSKQRPVPTANITQTGKQARLQIWQWTRDRTGPCSKNDKLEFFKFYLTTNASCIPASVSQSNPLLHLKKTTSYRSHSLIILINNLNKYRDKNRIKNTGSKFFKQEASDLEYPIVFTYKCYGKILSRPTLVFQTHSSGERAEKKHQNTKKPQNAKSNCDWHTSSNQRQTQPPTC